MGKRTPERSKLVRAQTPAFSRRKRSAGAAGSDDERAPEDEAVATAPPTEAAQTKTTPSPDERDAIETQPLAMRPAHARPEPTELPAIDPPDQKAEPWPDATPPPMAPVAAPFGGPPEMPKTTAPPPLVLGDVEHPAHMPAPREIPGGRPDDPASSPGSVPPGDSRSLRKADQFALVYRVGTSVITRTGTVGTRGQWRVVEYPTSAAAANSYAKECSRFVSEGFSDYRE